MSLSIRAMLDAGMSPREVHEAADKAHREAETLRLPTCTKCGQRCEAARFDADGRWVSPCCGVGMKRSEHVRG